MGQIEPMAVSTRMPTLAASSFSLVSCAGSEAFESVRTRKHDGVELQRLGIVEYLGGLPAEGPDRVRVYAQPDVRLSRSAERTRQRGAPQHSEERSGGACERGSSFFPPGNPVFYPNLALGVSANISSMDVIAHGLWAGAASMAANRKLERKIRFVWAFVWGVFPDVFAFLPMFVVLVRYRFFGQSLTPRLLFSHALQKNLPAILLPEGLYHLSHSLVVFSVVFRWCGVYRAAPPWRCSRGPCTSSWIFPRTGRACTAHLSCGPCRRTVSAGSGGRSAGS